MLMLIVLYTVVKTINGKAEYLTSTVFKKKPWRVNLWKQLWILFLKHACFFNFPLWFYGIYHSG